MRIDLYWHAYKYLPYERVLAEREARALFGQPPVRQPYGFMLEIGEALVDWRERAERLTYFREAVSDTGGCVVPRQAILEASANGEPKTSLPELGGSPTLTRQSTRYSAHGLHEYRGKFNPQIVHVVGNLLNIGSQAWVLDPFCGSGTTLLEAMHHDWNAVGLDINPLGIEISRAKLAALRVAPDTLLASSNHLMQNLRELVAGISLDTAFSEGQMRQVGGEGWETTLPNIEYLHGWFSASVLAQLAAILQAIARIPSPDMQAICRIVLSDILRGVSLQEPADLRIRRRKSPPPNAPAIPLFIKALEARREMILRTRKVFHADLPTKQDALLGDVRHLAAIVGKSYPNRLFDAVITSPPYVTALPYIDTQRLSLTVLGLIDADAIRATEQSLIGNREITDRCRKDLESDLQQNHYHLPASCWRLCCDLAAAFDPQVDGFRRRNQPALVYRYFSEMALMFEQVRQVLKPEARFVLVVGPNQTQLGEQRFTINTPQLLTDLAETRSFQLEERVELDTYQRYDVHQANSIRSETMLVLKVVAHAN